MNMSAVRFGGAFLVLFALYQSAEGLGARILDSFPVQAGLMLLCVLAAWPVGRYILGGRGFDAYALEWRRQVPIWVCAGIGLAIALKVLALVAGSALDLYRIGPPVASFSWTAFTGSLALALVSTFIPSIAEDIITRGIWWRLDHSLFRGARFILVTSLIYVLNHIYRLANGPLEWFMLFCFGVAYASAVVRTGSLWAAVGVHWGWNLANALLGQFAEVESVSSVTPLVSAIAHLLMAAVILGLPQRFSPWKRSESFRFRPARPSWR